MVQARGVQVTTHGYHFWKVSVGGFRQLPEDSARRARAPGTRPVHRGERPDRVLASEWAHLAAESVGRIHLRHRAGEERGQGQVRKLRAFAPDVCAWLGRSCQAKCDRLERPGRSLTDDSRAEAQRAGERCPHERRARARVRPFRAGNGAPAWSSLQTTRQMPASCSVDRSAARQPLWRVSRCERAVRSGE